MSRAIRVEVKPRYPDEPLERMIKRFNKKAKKERVIEMVLEKRYYEKPSVKRKKAQKRRKKVLDKLRKQKQLSNDK